MRDREKYLLDCLAEEASEVAIRASKAIRFGLQEIQPGQVYTNAARLRDELNDLLAVAEMLNAEAELYFQPCKDAMNAKQAKVNKFYNYSVELCEAEPQTQGPSHE